MRKVTVYGRVVADYLPFPEHHPLHEEGFLRNHFLIEGVEAKVSLNGHPQIIKLSYQKQGEFHNLILKFPISKEMAQEMQQQVATSSTSATSSPKKKPQWWGSLTFEVEEGEDWKMPIFHRTVKNRGKVVRISHMIMTPNAPIACEYLPNQVKKKTETEANFTLELQDAIEWAEAAFDDSLLVLTTETEAEALAETEEASKAGDLQEALTESFTSLQYEGTETEVENAAIC